MASGDAWQAGIGIGSRSKFNRTNMPKIGKHKYSKPVGEITTSDGQKLTPSAPMQFKKGGKVKRTGVAKVHKGELVLTASQAKDYKKKTRKRVASKR